MAKFIRWSAVLCLLCVLVCIPSKADASNLYYEASDGNIMPFTLPAKTLILTFDDGPSPFTPQILEVLKQKKVPATFFVIGNQAVKFPMLKQIYDQGHEIGNHT